MTRLPIIAATALFFVLVCLSVDAQQLTSDLIVRSLNGTGAEFEVNRRNNTIGGTNGMFVEYHGTVLTADSVFVDKNPGEAIADRNAHIQQGDQVWVGNHASYNLITHNLVADQFRSGKPPVFMEGKGLHGNVVSNKVEYGTYNATNAIITTDDVKKPAIKIRASRIRITPNDKLEAWNAVLFFDGVPMFYFPYYERNLGPHANNFDFVPGYKSSFGPFILGSYRWYLNDELNGTFHLDYREKRGVGVGPDFN